MARNINMVIKKLITIYKNVYLGRTDHGLAKGNRQNTVLLKNLKKII